MENCFIILELPFDPVENDENKINAAINKKIQQWQNESKNPRKTVIAKEKLESVSEIKKIMLDPELRNMEAKKALTEQANILKDLNYDILLKTSKGRITTKEIEELQNKYAKYNFSREQIMEKINVPINDKNDKENIKKLPESIVSQLETYFTNLGIDDMSIYTFLGIDKICSMKEAYDLAEKKLQFLLQKSEKLSQDEMEQKIAGIAKQLFSSEDLYNAYNEYLSACQYYRLNTLIREGAISNADYVNSEMFKVLLTICNNEYNMSGSECAKYVSNNCKYNGYQIDGSVIADILSSKQAVPIPESQPKIDIKEKTDVPLDIRPDFLIKMEERICLIGSEIKKLESNLFENDSKYKSAGKLPNMMLLIIYEIVIMISLLINAFMYLQFGHDMNISIKYIITLASFLMIVDAGYNGYLLYKIYMYSEYKRLFLLSRNKYYELIEKKYKHMPFTIDEINRKASGSVNYLNEILSESDTLYTLCLNMRNKAITFLTKFNRPNNYGYLTLPRIIFVLVFMIAFYYIVLKYFPEAL